MIFFQILIIWREDYHKWRPHSTLDKFYLGEFRKTYEPRTINV